MNIDPTSTSVNAAAVTVLEIQDSNRANKLVRRLPDGSIEKLGGVESGIYRAQQVAADVESLTGLLSAISADPRLVLMPGLFRDAGPDPFLVWPRRRIARRILGIDPDTVPPKRLAELTRGWFEHGGERVVARTRDNTLFSRWCYLDRDLVAGMPEELAELGRDEWLAEMAELWPTFGEAAKVIVPSTSGRVLVDGKPYSTKPSFHCFFQVDDPDDLRNRVWLQLLVKAFAATVLLSDCALGFMREKHSRTVPGLVTGRQAWSIWDPTTCWPERLVFDGAPVVEGAGLEVLPPAPPVVIPGGVVNVAAFADLTPAQQQPAAARKVMLARTQRPGPGGARVAVQFVTSPILTLDHELDTEQGPMTMREYWIVGGDHLRCQAPFRESSSLAAYLSRHRSGEPFVFDTGADTKFTLTDAARIGPRPEEFIAALEAWLLAHGETIAGPLLAEGDRFIREIGAAAQRHERGEIEVEALIRQLAERLAKPYGTTRSKLEAAIRRTFKAGRKEAKGAQQAAAAAAVAAAVAGGGETVRGAILGWLRERYRPLVRRGAGAVYSEAEAGWITYQALYPDEALRERMMRAVDFPRDDKGQPLEDMVPHYWREWRSFAWGDLLRSLPFEHAAGAPRTEASEDFLLAIQRLHEATAMLPTPNTGSLQLQSLATAAWRKALHAAQMNKGRPTWVQIDPYLFYARIKSGRCWIGFKAGAAGQLQRPIALLAGMTDTALTRRCHQERVGSPSKFGKNQNINLIYCDGKIIRCTILRPSFVHRFGLFTDDPLFSYQQNNAGTGEKSGSSAAGGVIDLATRKR